MNKLPEGSEREICIMKTGIKPAVIDEIIRYARDYGLHKVILFGSRARGDYDRASDIDLAVAGGDIIQFSFACEENTSTLLRFDVIDMERVQDAGFVARIEAEGILLYENCEENPDSIRIRGQHEL